MKTKIMINNDRKIKMHLRIASGQPPYVESMVTFEPAQVKVVELDVKEGDIPYFKIWETGQAYLSTIKLTEALASIEE